MDKVRTITISPKMFVNKPFIACPKCKKNEFGVLMINSYSYVRRCNACMHVDSYPLPKLSRKIIYIDQFAISDMMKSINKDLGKTEKVNPFFKSLFEKLDSLNKLQLIICPDSENHFNESLVSPFYEALKRLYEQLSHGTSFYDPGTIKRFQVSEAFFKWLGEEKEPLDIGSIIMGENIDEWQSRFIISVSLRDQDPELALQIRAERDQSSDALIKVFKSWQNENSKTFNDWFTEESDSFGELILNSYLSSVVDYASMASGKLPVSMGNISSMLSTDSVTVTYIHTKLKEKGYTEEQIVQKSVEFFKSQELKNSALVKLLAIMFASLAKEAATGRKKPPTKGMLNDVETIASYAPYCDALFVDNECRRLLSTKDAKEKYDISGKLFSQNNKEEFIEFLDQIEKTASKEHLELVRKVYGESWESPFTTMFD